MLRSSAARQPIVLSLVLSSTLVATSPVRAQPRAVDTDRSTITVRVSKSGLLRAFGDDHIIQAPIADGSLDDSGAASVQLAIDAKRLRVLDPGLSAKDREEVQTRMLGPEVVDANRFPEIRLQSTAVQVLGPGHLLVRADLELHGHTRQVSVEVGRERGRYRGSAVLRQTDFGITPISIAGGTVKVKDEIAIEFDIVTISQP